MCVTTAFGCAGAVDDPATTETVGTTDEAILGGTPASMYPEAVDIVAYSGTTAMGACSGTLIASRWVLTAGHCVAGFDNWMVSAPFAAQQFSAAHYAATKYVNSGSDQVNVKAVDIGLIDLDNPITLFSYPTLATAEVSDGTYVQNLGRIDNGTYTTSMYLSPAVQVYDAKVMGMPNDYVATVEIQEGDSGGAVVLKGTHTIVAVNSGVSGNTEALARVDVAWQGIQDQISKQGQ